MLTASNWNERFYQYDQHQHAADADVQEVGTALVAVRTAVIAFVSQGSGEAELIALHDAAASCGWAPETNPET